MIQYRMPVINVLSEHLRNKIAAGEVVERPASVVKELIENSIDAGSTRITVESVRAGKNLLRVSDNGAGMEREDALLAFERYTTSKIREEGDLFSLVTMGFRGEALSSIASVAKVKLSTAYRPTKVDDGLSPGTCIEIAGGDVKEIKDCPAEGTSLEVKELFFNTPARRKFLKSDTTENYHIIDAVTREALSHYHIGFFLLMDREEVLGLPAAASFRERLMQIHGRDFVEGLVESTRDAGGMKVSLFVSKPSHLRNNRNNQYLFINRRPVKDPAVSSAVYRSYEGLLPGDKHPVFFIFLTVDPAGVDFNVHPAKREVRFQDKSSVFTFVYQSVKETLRENSPAAVTHHLPDGISERGEPYVAEHHSASTYGVAGPVPESLPVMESMAESRPFLYLGDTLVALADRGGLVVLDYHAAHERVNYERLLKKTDMHICPLLFPRQVKLAAGQYRVILENPALLYEFGVEVEDFGHGAVIVRSLPEMLRDADTTALLNEVAAALLRRDSGEAVSSDKGLEPFDAVRKSVAARMACHASIRGKEAPDSVRIGELLKSLALCENPDSCPHGRPTRIFMSRGELRKMFRK
jgi:DNA mismatch repair protein MutL